LAVLVLGSSLLDLGALSLGGSGGIVVMKRGDSSERVARDMVLGGALVINLLVAAGRGSDMMLSFVAAWLYYHAG